MSLAGILGRLTRCPTLKICGLLPAPTAEAPTAVSCPDPRAGVTESATGFNEWTVEETALYKETNLPVVRLERGWDAVRPRRAVGVGRVQGLHVVNVRSPTQEGPVSRPLYRSGVVRFRWSD